MYVGQILKNKLSNGQVIVVRVMALNVAGTNMPRVCDNRESLPDGYLIEKNRTWAAPLENLVDDEETKSLSEAANTPMNHKDALVQWRF